jgi:hypothetical protein
MKKQQKKPQEKKELSAVEQILAQEERNKKAFLTPSDGPHFGTVALPDGDW